MVRRFQRPCTMFFCEKGGCLLSKVLNRNSRPRTLYCPSKIRALGLIGKLVGCHALFFRGSSVTSCPELSTPALDFLGAVLLEQEYQFPSVVVPVPFSNLHFPNAVFFSAIGMELARNGG